jgi:type I restriction enzyme, R subunit
VKVVTTGSASDPLEWHQHIGNKSRRDLIARRAKDAIDPLRLVLVRDMWLTGFDAPAMHTMYVDKPMRGHGLMQAIARVNRVFRDKPAGLVVDYIGIAQSLKEALSQYSPSDQRQAGIDQAEAIAVLQEKHEIVASMFHGFPYRQRLEGTAQERLQLMADAIDFIQGKQHEAAAGEATVEGKKRAHRRFQDAVLALSKAFALTASSDEARAIRLEVAFFQAVLNALTKTEPNGRARSAERDMAVRQIIDRAIASTEIVDILAAAGIETPNIGILSDEFLAELQTTQRKNLALEALKKLLGDEIRSRSQTNVVEGKRFSERLTDAIARYHTNAISTVEVIQELIQMAKELKDRAARAEEDGLTPDEIAFYDALAQNDSAVQLLGNDHLKVIAQLLLDNLKQNVTVDWAHRESARARLRVLVKDILEEHGYPPDLSKEAVQTVLLQAEALSAHWTQPGSTGGGP